MNGNPNCADCRFSQIESYSKCYCTYWETTKPLTCWCHEFQER